MATKQFLDLPGLEVYHSELMNYLEQYIVIFYDTTANWNAKSTLVGKQGCIYVYSDYQQDGDGNDIPGIKIGDGNSYLIDAPFTDTLYKAHIEDTVKHITSAERTFWNNKVTCYLDPNNSETLVFSKN